MLEVEQQFSYALSEKEHYIFRSENRIVRSKEGRMQKGKMQSTESKRRSDYRVTCILTVLREDCRLFSFTTRLYKLREP